MDLRVARNYPPKKTSLGETLAEIFRAKESRQESCQESRIGSYAWLSERLSPRLVFLKLCSFSKISAEFGSTIRIIEGSIRASLGSDNKGGWIIDLGSEFQNSK